MEPRIKFCKSSINHLINTQAAACLKAAVLVCLLSACACQLNGPDMIGFWEGPHPENPDMKFYIQFEYRNDSLIARGYWAQNNFYQSGFRVDNAAITGNSVNFEIPGWGCSYSGTLTDNQHITGGFSCPDEPFDEVFLTRNNEIENYLVLPEPEMKDPSYQYKYHTPETMDDNIEVGGLRSANDSLFIYSLIPEILTGEYGRMNSFLMMKEGKLICEEYFYGYTVSNLHQIESCTKSITSLLTGIASDHNLITDLDEPIYEIFPAYERLKGVGYNAITIKHLLTMTSGFDPQNDQLFTSDNRIDFALKRELKYQPGTTFQYDGGNTEILGAIIKAKTKMFADEFAEQYLFNPLNINLYSWNLLKQDGFPSVGGSLRLRPRDMVKIGWLVIKGGNYKGKQLISERWISESTSVKTETHIPGDDYSYQWWNLKLASGPKSYRTIWANGWGSQFIFIFPELNTVIVTTGHNYENDSWAITNGLKKYLGLLDSGIYPADVTIQHHSDSNKNQ